MDHNHNDVDATASSLRLQGLDGAAGAAGAVPLPGLGSLLTLALGSLGGTVACGKKQHAATKAILWGHVLSDISDVGKGALKAGAGWI